MGNLQHVFCCRARDDSWGLGLDEMKVRCSQTTYFSGWSAL